MDVEANLAEYWGQQSALCYRENCERQRKLNPSLHLSKMKNQAPGGSEAANPAFLTRNLVLFLFFCTELWFLEYKSIGSSVIKISCEAVFISESKNNVGQGLD